MQLEEVVGQIRRTHMIRQNAIRRQGQIDKAMQAWVRLHRTDWPEIVAAGNLTKADKERVKKEVTALIKAARKKTDDAVLVRHLQISDMARTMWDADRDEAEDALAELGKELPIHDWWVDMPGRSVGGLTAIVGELAARSAPLAFSNYPKPDHVWSRLGLAPYKGAALSVWRKEGGLSSKEWTDNPYNPSRLAIVFTVTQSLLKKQLIGKAKTGSGETEADGRYGEAWVRRRKHTAVTHPEWKPMHSLMDAVRYTSKVLTCDMWWEWKRALA